MVICFWSDSSLIRNNQKFWTNPYSWWDSITLHGSIRLKYDCCVEFYCDLAFEHQLIIVLNGNLSIVHCMGVRELCGWNLWYCAKWLMVLHDLQDVWAKIETTSKCYQNWTLYYEIASLVGTLSSKTLKIWAVSCGKQD